MRALLAAGASPLVIPGGVRECCYMRHGAEVAFLRQRAGFVRIALQHGAPYPNQITTPVHGARARQSLSAGACAHAGAPLVPVFVFGQSNSYYWFKFGPPLVPQWLAETIARRIGAQCAAHECLFVGRSRLSMRCRCRLPADHAVGPLGHAYAPKGAAAPAHSSGFLLPD